MVDRVFYSGLMALLFLLAPLLFIACGGGGAGLSRAEVEEIVRSELADAPAPEPGLTAAEVEEAIRRAMADMPQPEAGLTENEVEEISRLQSPPSPQPRADQHFVSIQNCECTYVIRGIGTDPSAPPLCVDFHARFSS